MNKPVKRESKGSGGAGAKPEEDPRAPNIIEEPVRVIPVGRATARNRKKTVRQKKR